MKKGSPILIYSGAVAFAVITGLSFMFSKIGLMVSDPWDLLAHRFTMSFLAILPPILFKWTKTEFSRERFMRLLPVALFYPMLFFTFQTFSLKFLSSSEAGIFLAMMPAFTLVFASFFLKEKSTLLQKISVALCVGGVLYISFKKGASFDPGNIKGILLILMAALSFPIYSILVKKRARDFSVSEMTYVMIIISFVSFNAIAAVRHIYNGTVAEFFMLLLDSRFLAAAVYLGVLSSLFTSMLTNYILTHIGPAKMSVFSNLGTVITIAAGVVFLGEKIYYYHIIGSALIILGVLGTNYQKKIRKPQI